MKNGVDRVTPLEVYHIGSTLEQPVSVSISGIPSAPIPSHHHSVSNQAVPTPDSETQGSDLQNRNIQCNAPEHNIAPAQEDASFEEFLNLADDCQITAALEAAKEKVEPRYHRGLEIMSKYQAPGVSPASLPDMKKMTMIVQAVQAAVREDLPDFVSRYLKGWLKSGLWPISPDTVANDHSMQCSWDLADAEMYDDQMARPLMRRLVRVRLCYWHDEQMKSICTGASPRQPDQGYRLDTHAADLLLQKASWGWEDLSEKERQTIRDKFHERKRVGRRWCELVQYLGPGILVTCDARMDALMNRREFPPYGAHAIAYFVTNYFSNLTDVCRYFNPVVKTFLRRGKMGDSDLRNWLNGLDGDMLRAVIKKLNEEQPPQPESIQNNPRFAGIEYSDLTWFIREALASE
ncbi:hypothetical protein AnigIFM63604_005769 [Aspergillus niger]|uniref:Uncharacterized protein n=1 Tax=Aspergillus niger TaxID=5061 RepID=A0A505I9U7_ASPNG|nr:hypothetical protein CAN33_0054810 [Aspergillus niger]GLA56215.1 hypothetical protein AnigIFM63604_005769 [Aspergillus niger]